MDVRQKINAGLYNVKMAYPTKPSEPPILRRQTRDLTSSEIKALPALREEYQTRVEIYKEERKLYAEANDMAEQRFRDDVEAENDMVGHPKADILWSKAWEHGHSSGFADVLNWYEDLLELVK